MSSTPSTIKSGNNYQKFILHSCEGCGKERWVRLQKGLPLSVICRSCAGKTHRGTRNSRWQGGRKETSQGYIKIWLDRDDFFYPMADEKTSYVYEHRLVVAKRLGRCLHSWEIVHHKGAKYPKGSRENRSDNRYPENLQLVTDDRHKQITILENKIAHQEKRIGELEQRIILLEAERILQNV